MTVFAVIASNDPVALEKKISGNFATQDFHKVDEKTWLVSPPVNIVTAKELVDFLGISSGAAGRVLVLLVSSYYGYHARDTWDWLTAKGV